MSSNAYMAKYMLRRYHNRIAEAKRLLGGACAVCGVSDDLEALEFDHIDPADKKFTIGNIGSASKAKFDEELKKCQLLCNSCHKEKHASKFPHGTAQRYWRGCKCQPCTTANTQHSIAYKKRTGRR
jgi:5-methylcytosine-specific restriction endonuclease McrA